MRIQPPNVACTNKKERKMSDRFQKDRQNHLANGRSNREFQVDSDFRRSETRFDADGTESRSSVSLEEFPAPIAKFLGLKLLQAQNGMAVVEFVADERHANPAGTLPGAVFFAIH